MQENYRRPVAAGLPGETLEFESLTEAARWLFKYLHNGEEGTSRQVAGLEGNIRAAAIKGGTSHGIDWILI